MTQITYGHVFHDTAISGHAKAIFGDVHVSCPDFLEHMTPPQKRRALLNALFYENMYRRSAHIQSAQSQTCDWIWSTTFANWLAEAHPNTLFWISGKPGSGKSTLMKYLSANEETRSRLPTTSTTDRDWSISHFFFDFRAAKEMPNTEQGLLRSLLYQITSELPLERNVLAKYELTLEQILSTQQVDQMVNMLTEVIVSEKLNVLFFVDGLDEYEHSIRELIQFLEKVRSRTKLRLCLASRPEPVIQAMLGGLPHVEVQDYNASGIEAYVRTSVDEIGTNISIDKTISIGPSVTYILSRAEGVFLWVHFAVNTLVEHLVIGCVESEIRHALELLPTQLDKMYDRIFAQVPSGYRNEASMILLLIESASHVVDLTMLHRLWLFLHASLGLETTHFEKISLEQFQLRLRGFLGGLLDFEIHINDLRSNFSEGVTALQNKTVSVRLLHETLRAYMSNRSLIKQWMHEKLAMNYPDHVWLRVYTEVLQHAHSSLDTFAWSIVKDVEQAYKLRRVAQPHPWRAARATFINRISEYEAKLPEGRTTLDAISLHVLPYAIVNFSAVAEAAAIYQGPLFENYSKALQSPLLLLFDTLQFQDHQIGVPMRYRDHSSIYDLVFAAARAWPSYIEAHSDRLVALSTTQRNYLIVCACGGSATFDCSKRFKVMGGRPRDEAISVLAKLLAGDPVVDNLHIAFLMQIEFSDKIGSFMTELRSSYIRTQGFPPKLSLNPRRCEWVKFMHSLSHLDGLDLIEFWLRLNQTIDVFKQWLYFLADVGFDLCQWQDESGSNLMLHALERAEFREAGHWRTSEVFDNNIIMKQALALEEFGIRLPTWTPAGRLMLGRLRDLHQSLCASSSASAQSLVVQEYDNYSTDTIQEVKKLICRIESHECPIPQLDTNFKTSITDQDMPQISQVSDPFTADKLASEDRRYQARDDLVARIAKSYHDRDAEVSPWTWQMSVVGERISSSANENWHLDCGHDEVENARQVSHEEKDDSDDDEPTLKKTNDWLRELHQRLSEGMSR